VADDLYHQWVVFIRECGDLLSWNCLRALPL